MKRVFTITLIALLCSCATTREPIIINNAIAITDFTNEELTLGRPIGWKTHGGICRKFHAKAQYEITKLDDKEVLHIKADDSGTILLNMVGFDPAEYPFLSWRATNILPKSRGRGRLEAMTIPPPYAWYTPGASSLYHIT